MSGPVARGDERARRRQPRCTTPVTRGGRAQFLGAAAAREVLDGEDAPGGGRGRNRRGRGRNRRDVPAAKQGKAGGRAHTPAAHERPVGNGNGNGRWGRTPAASSRVGRDGPHPRRPTIRRRTSPPPPLVIPSTPNTRRARGATCDPRRGTATTTTREAASRPRERERRRSRWAGRVGGGARAGRMTGAAAAAAGVCASRARTTARFVCSAGRRRRSRKPARKPTLGAGAGVVPDGGFARAARERFP